MVSVTVSSASKPPSFARGLPVTIDLLHDATVADVKAAISAKFPKFYASRQKISLKTDKKLLGDGVKLSSILGDQLQNGELQVKDLGPQISWTATFIIEYAGPLIAHPVIYYLPKVWYGTEVQHSALQKYVFAFVMLHFIKRELETLLVHRFSHSTMPLRHIFRNSGHYHIFGGILLALDVYRPKFSAHSPYILGTYRNNEQFLWVCAGIWALAELSNLHTHLTLRALRPANSHIRAIPYGYGFSLVSCPNYFFEAVGWGVICAMTGSLAAYVFLILAVCIMSLWAVKKHRNYKRDFGKEYPKNRKAIFPFIL